MSLLVDEQLIAAADGTRLYLRRQGTGRHGIVLCDGILCEGFIYRYLWQQLGVESNSPNSLIHWNYRGHGRSGEPRDITRLGVPAHAADLVSLCSALQLYDVVLVGHSYGVSVVLEAALRGNLLVRGLILLCGTAGSVTTAFRGTGALSRLIPHLRQAVEEYPRLARSVWSRLPSSLASRAAIMAGEVNNANLDPEDIQPYFEHLRRLNPSLSVRMLEEASAYSATSELVKLQCPALVVAGSRDTFIPPSQSKALSGGLPNAEYMELTGGTHVCPLEFPTKLHAGVQKFLARIGAAS